jgi:hypothetical protein
MSTSVHVSSCCPQSNQDIQNIFPKTPRLSVMATTMLLIYLHHIQIFVNSRRSEMLHGKIDGGFNILSSSNTHTYNVTFSIGRRCRRVQQFKKGKQRQRSSFAFQIVEWEVNYHFIDFTQGTKRNTLHKARHHFTFRLYWQQLENVTFARAQALSWRIWYFCRPSFPFYKRLLQTETSSRKWMDKGSVQHLINFPSNWITRVISPI